MNKHTVTAAFALFAAAGTWLGAAGSQATASQPSIPTDRTAMSGGYLFSVYCAPCHGANGKGEGTVGLFLETVPPDLTQLTATHHGVFPRARVERYVTDGTGDLDAPHPPGRMPHWGPTFRSFDPSEARARQRIENIVAYVETLQSEIQIASGPIEHHVLTGDVFRIEKIWMRVAPNTQYHRWLSSGTGSRSTLVLTSDPRRFGDRHNVRILTGRLICNTAPSEMPIVHEFFLTDDATGAFSPVTFETEDGATAAKFEQWNNAVVSLVIEISQ
jgi:mono/diheme cytochrome c family protein